MIQDRKRFLSMLNNMKEHILRYRKQTLMHEDRARKSIAAHEKIVFALGIGDPILTEYLMRVHIQESKADAMEINFGSRGRRTTSGLPTCRRRPGASGRRANPRPRGHDGRRERTPGAVLSKSGTG